MMFTERLGGGNQGWAILRWQCRHENLGAREDHGNGLYLSSMFTLLLIREING